MTNYLATETGGAEAVRRRRRARLTCEEGHIWLIKSRYLDVEGDEEHWCKRRCPHCGRRPMAVVVLDGGQIVQVGNFRWWVKVVGWPEGHRSPVHRLSRQEEKAALARLRHGLNGGVQEPILTRAKSNGLAKTRQRS